MTDAHLRDRWSHTAQLMTLIANCNRDPKKRPTPFMPSDFNPMTSRAGESSQRPQVIPADITALRDAFCAPVKRPHPL